MGAVAADNVDAPAAAQEHFMPREHSFVRERIAEALVEVHHHFGDAALGGRYLPPIDAKAELLAQGRLNAVAVENFAFDFRGLHRFVADKLNFENVPVFWSDMLEDADKLAGAQQELPFQRLQSRGTVRECRPIRLLPIPCHEL